GLARRPGNDALSLAGAGQLAWPGCGDGRGVRHRPHGRAHRLPHGGTMTSPSPDDAQAPGTPAAETPSGWLRRQRQAPGAAGPAVARRLRDTATAIGDPLPGHPSLTGMIRRWERGAGVSERYRLHFCRTLGVPPSQYGTGEPDPASNRA